MNIDKTFIMAAFYISLAVVGIVEAIKAQVPNLPAWGKLALCAVLTAIGTVGFYYIGGKPELITTVAIGVLSFGFGQVEYNFLAKLFKAIIAKTKKKTEDELVDEISDKVIENIAKGVD